MPIPERWLSWIPALQNWLANQALSALARSFDAMTGAAQHFQSLLVRVVTTPLHPIDGHNMVHLYMIWALATLTSPTSPHLRHPTRSGPVVVVQEEIDALLTAPSAPTTLKCGATNDAQALLENPLAPIQV